MAFQDVWSDSQGAHHVQSGDPQRAAGDVASNPQSLAQLAVAQDGGVDGMVGMEGCGGASQPARVDRRRLCAEDETAQVEEAVRRGNLAVCGRYAGPSGGDDADQPRELLLLSVSAGQILEEVSFADVFNEFPF